LVERVFLGASLVYTLLAQFATNSLKAAIGDATLFAYGGRLIANGMIPYRDFWDNKPPLIFYINALSYRLFGTTWLAPTTLQAFVSLMTVLAFAALARRLMPGSSLQRIAFIGLATFGLNLPVFMQDGANLTETYLLLPMALCITLLDPFGQSASPRRWFAAGGIAGVAFLLRPNAASLGAVALSCLLMRRGLLGVWNAQTQARHLGSFFVGGLVPLAAATLYFASHGVAQEMWFATLGYQLTAYDELFLLRPKLFEARRFYMFQEAYGIPALVVAGLSGALFRL